MNRLIIAISGKLEAGKDTVSQFLRMNDSILRGGPPPTNGSRIPPSFPFAGPLKAMCMSLGLRHEQVWGSQADKETLTDIRWENLPHYERLCGELYCEAMDAAMREDREVDISNIPTGLMTAREVMEQVGEMMRMFDPNYWVKQLLRSIQASGLPIATVPDLRHQNEFHQLKKVGAVIIRLTRVTERAAANTHLTNVALDSDRFDWGQFDLVLHNQEMTVKETCDTLLRYLVARELVHAPITAEVLYPPEPKTATA